MQQINYLLNWLDDHHRYSKHVSLLRNLYIHIYIYIIERGYKYIYNIYNILT